MRDDIAGHGTETDVDARVKAEPEVAQGPSSIETRGTPPPSTRGLSHTAKLACCRASPLVCPNQALVEELDVIRRMRWLEGEEVNALSYSRTIAVLKGSSCVSTCGLALLMSATAYPRRITERLIRDEVPKLPFVGPKSLALVRPPSLAIQSLR